MINKLTIGVVFVTIVAVTVAFAADSDVATPPRASTDQLVLADMLAARAGHWATLLPDGRVWIYGGVPSGVQPVSEFFDPSTGQFASADAALTARGRHAGVVLADGTIVFAVGIVLQDGTTIFIGASNAEIYDPTTDTISPTGPYVDPTPVFWDTATLLSDGTVLFAGCYSDACFPASELFDPQTGTFSLTGPRQTSFGFVCTATLLMDGTVLLMESNSDGFPDDAELYDPTTATFTDIGHLDFGHAFSAAVRLPDGAVLTTGGQLAGGYSRRDTKLYHPDTGTFTFAGNMTVGRHSHTATLLGDGTVLMTGGYTSYPIRTASAEILSPQ